jgi:glycerophosphoryl diester phosphodiesterase
MTVEIYGHRGCAGLMPENALPAYEEAMEIGVDAVDMDIGMSKDGVVMVAHDPELSPDLTQLNGQWISESGLLLKDLTYAQLQRYEIGFMKEKSVYAEKHPIRKSMSGVRMPSLQEAIAFVKNQAGGDKVKFQIEIKTQPNTPDKTFSPEVIARAVVKVVQDEGVSDRTEIHSFDWRALNDLKTLDPSITRSYLTSTAWEGYDARPVLNFPALLHEMKDLGAQIWCPDRIDLFTHPDGRSHVQLAHQLGLGVVVWTVNEVVDMKTLMEWGVDGLISDYPDRLKKLLE